MHECVFLSRKRLQKREAEMTEAPMPDEATVPVRSVGVVTLHADRRGNLMGSDGGRIRDIQTILAHCHSG